MEVLITIIFVVIMLTLFYCAYQLKYISELLRDEKKPFLAEENHNTLQWQVSEVERIIKKRGRPLGSKNKKT